MEQRDLIKDQIEQLGKVLGKIIANFLGLKTQGDVNSAIDVTNQILKSELDLDFEKVILLESEKLEEYIESLKLGNENLELLSKYYLEVGIIKKNQDFEEGEKLIKTAKRLLDVASNKTNTISFERIYLMNKIEKELQQSI